jgi:large subunit ribosomal protein L20
MFGGGSRISTWRRRLKWARRLVLLASLAGAAQRWLRQNRTSSPAPAPRPLAVNPATGTDSGSPADVNATTSWVTADGTEAPDGYPVKVNTRSGIYHLEGGVAYERTRPDRWYRSAADAEADGFRPSKI